MEINKITINNLFGQGIKIHIYFCTVLLMLFAVITFQTPSPQVIIPRAILCYLEMIGCIYTGRWLIQQFLVKNRWFYLILLSITAILFFSAAGITGMMYLTNFREGTDRSEGFWIITPLLVILALFCGGLAAVTRFIFRQQIRESEIVRQQKETELNELSNKLSPHFLFNTLNNIYSLSIDDHRKVPASLLQLSDLLRYSLYSTADHFVLLNDEMEYLSNYIALEKLRMNNQVVINVKMSNSCKEFRIAPMVLIVFVENAFKHARNTLNKTIFINIEIEAENSNLHFKAENSCDQEQQNSSINKNYAGLGIITTVKRLDLLYPHQYSLNHGHHNGNYFVELMLENHV